MEATGKRSWSGIAVPALVLVLLLVQFALGFGRGFDVPHKGILGLLESPGALLGWGGVVLLAILLAWLVAGWAGRDLFGLQGPGGLVFRLVGCVAFGVAVAGLLGLFGGATHGGSVGAYLGRLLDDNLGGTASTILLVVMAIPALLLAISPLVLGGPARTKEGGVPRSRLADLEPKPGLYESGHPQARPLYPERRYDEDGNEIPMTFDARDVGAIRFAEEAGEEEEEEDPEAKKLDVEEPDGLREGVRYADDEDEEPEADEEDAEAEDAEAEDAEAEDAESGDEEEDEGLPEGVRYADEALDEDEEEPGEGDEEDGDEGLPDGVRYADEPVDEGEEGDEDEGEVEEEGDLEEDEEAEDEEAEDEPEEPARSGGPERARRGGGGEPGEPGVEAAKPAPRRRRPKLDEIENEASGARYRAKLEGSGIFDEPEAPAPPKRKAAPKRKATPKRKKKAAPGRKPAAKRKAAPRKKAAAKKKATPRKKVVAKNRRKARARSERSESKGKAAPRKKAAARKKAAPKRKKKAAPGRKPAAKRKAAPRKKAAAKKKATPRKKVVAKNRRKAPARSKRSESKRKAAPRKKSAGKRKAAGATAKKAKPKRKGARKPPDETYRKAVEVAMERGAASSVLLSRRLGIGYAQARALIETLVEDGVLGEMTPSGSRPLLITPSEWKKRL